MIKELYTIKSFFSMGDSKFSCFGCTYCRADDNKEYYYHTCPGQINPIFRTLPVSVNLFYGDPVLQWDNTLKILKDLEEDNHKGPVIIVTKGKLPIIPKLDLDLHVGISIGPDIVSQQNFESNLETVFKGWYKSSIEYRPICCGLNDGEDVMNYIFGLAEKYNLPVAYSGLQLPPNGLPDIYKPYSGHKFGGQKYISPEVEKKLKEIATVPIFKKTSCLISWMHGRDSDYNAHYLKPIGNGCLECPMWSKCKETPGNKLKLPFEYEVKQVEDYKCSFVRAGLCKFPNPECLQMRGPFIVPKLDLITRGDARVIKWLTGMMVDNIPNLIETPFLSDWWKEG